MTELDTTTLKVLIQLLDDKVTAGSWQELLNLLHPTGVADMLQIQNTLCLPRDKVRRMIDQVQACSAKLPPILEGTNQTTQRAGVRGRTPTIYRLGKSGAALLRTLGNKDARECQLKTETEIQHAVLMLDVRLAALKAGLTIRTDKELPYGDNHCLRPDNQVVLPDGSVLLYENEQAAQSAIMRRITESLSNKWEYFKTQPGKSVSPVVRMIVNAARGAEWDRTIKTWKQVALVVAQNQPSPFRILAMPHAEFLSNPDWESEPDPDRWIDLTPIPEKVEIQVKGKAITAPQRFLAQSAQEDRLVLIALWQQFLENGQFVPSEAPHPNPVFFEIMRLIHSASFNPNADALSKAAMPWASIYLLNHYLRMHPTLKEQLHQSITRAATAMRWNTINILHRVQVVIERFLAYHGWRNGGGIHVLANTYGYDSSEGSGINITARILDPELLMQPGQTVMPTKEEVTAAESALAWVLWSLFAYADRLDLPTCGFW